MMRFAGQLHPGWLALIPPTSEKIIGYVRTTLHEYVALYQHSEPPFGERDEPTITKGLAAFLAQKNETGQQPFPGDFFGELSHYDLDEANGKPVCVGRTDIEWRLHGNPALVVEFKILDGRKKRITAYIEGMMRFVKGRYSKGHQQGAMYGLIKGTGEDENTLPTEITAKSALLNCEYVNGEAYVEPSSKCPGSAKFDTVHTREAPALSPFHLSHLFFKLPSNDN